MRDEHLTTEQAAGFLDCALPDADRAVVEAHLAACAECRAEVVTLRRVLAQPRRRRSMLGIGAGLAAAAALLLVVVPRTAQPPATHRAPEAQTQAPVPLEPRGRGGRPVAFQWRSFTGADEYRVTLFDTTGSVLFRVQTEDTTASFPDSVSLAASRSYHWKVEVTTTAGSWVGSDLVTFEVTPGAREARP